jgi:hypothetical protein
LWTRQLIAMTNGTNVGQMAETVDRMMRMRGCIISFWRCVCVGQAAVVFMGHIHHKGDVGEFLIKMRRSFGSQIICSQKCEKKSSAAYLLFGRKNTTPTTDLLVVVY